MHALGDGSVGGWLDAGELMNRLTCILSACAENTERWMIFFILYYSEECFVYCVFLMERNTNKLSAANMDLLTDLSLTITERLHTSSLWTRPLKNMKREELG